MISTKPERALGVLLLPAAAVVPAGRLAALLPRQPGGEEEQGEDHGGEGGPGLPVVHVR